LLGLTTRFFFYGTLLDADLQEAVIGRAVPAAALAPASIAGYRRVRAEGQAYPMLVPGLATDCVEGVIASGFTGAEIDRLIAYEGEGYVLQALPALLADGGATTAQVFLPVAGGLKTSNESWNLSAWQRDHKSRALRRLR
jgi:hypothetical protein